LGTARKPRPKWYRTPIKRAELKRLAQTDNRTGLLYLLGFSALLGTSGLLAALSIGSGWALPAFMFYGGVWVFATSIAHETCHGTAFRTRLLNEIVLYLAGMMVQQTPTGLRWTHLRHHNQTSIVGKDVEIVLTNPMDWTGFLSRQLADLNSIGYYARSVVQLAVGRPDQDHRACLSKRALTRVTWEARSFLLVYCFIALWALATWSWWPILMFFLPRIAGAPVHGIILATQHTGLAQGVHDYRVTTRTMYINSILQFIYWNMNYHVEHHMYRMVPFHALPGLHAAIRHDCPVPTQGVISALREMFSAVARQQVEPAYVLPRPSR
jgi:fatty acid desaturase